MPTLLRENSLRFFFFSNEGTEPPHIHVESGDGYAKFWLEPVELVYSHGLSAAALRQARLLVIKYQAEFRRKWDEHFGS